VNRLLLIGVASLGLTVYFGGVLLRAAFEARP
jgi:hypothetical protein